MIKIYDADQARQTILKRIPPDEIKVTDQMLDRIESTFGARIQPEEAVKRIISDIRLNGDRAVTHWSSKLDGFPAGAPIRVPVEDIHASVNFIKTEELEALKTAAQRIRDFYAKQPAQSWITNELGGTLGQYMRPHRRVGVYVPGGTAPLPSSVLMSAVPAQVAGVKEIVIVTPPSREPSKTPLYPHIPPIILAACAVIGIDEVYAIGGAQAIGTLAFGTQTIPPVDKIFGPGNLFVTLAKRQVFGMVGIDGLAGPTETVVIADDSARPDWVAADLLAQAEHDVLATAILMTPSRSLAYAVQAEVEKQSNALPRAEILAYSLPGQSGIVITKDIDEAIDLSNLYAPEHLCLAARDPWPLGEKITNAGGIFMGEMSFEVLGDYIAGPSHVMPTGGSARFASPVNVWDFIHIISIIALDEKTTQKIAPQAALLARAEGLEGHARSADKRVK